MLKPLITINDLKRYSATAIFQDIYTLKQAVDALRPFDAERNARILQKFRLDWNYNSNAIEGNSLTYGETVALLMNGVTAKGKPLKDHLDIKGHDEAIDFLMSLIKNERPLSEADIRELHTILLKENYETDAITDDGTPTKKTIEVGKYKTTPNHVRTKTGQIHYYAAPNEVPILMCELVEWYNAAKDDPEIDTIVLAAFFHHRFVAIHPFDDGNGRMTRLLMNLMLMRKGFPPIVIKKIDRETYYGALSQADTGEYLPFFEFIAEQAHYALHIQQRGARGEPIDEDDDFEKELFLLEKMQKGENGVIELDFSQVNAQNAFEHSVLPLYDSIGKKVESAGQLFITNYTGYYKRKDGIRNFAKEHPYYINKDSKVTLNQDDIEHRFLIISHFLNSYKSMVNPFNIQISLTLKYETLHFEIFYSIKNFNENIFNQRFSLGNISNKRNKVLLFKQPYHKTLTPTEIKTATKTVSDALLQKIKELSSV